VIRYYKEDSPCNEIFLRENPEMAEDCRKVREHLTFVNKYQKSLRVHLKDGIIESTDFKIRLDDKDFMKTRDIILLNSALIVHDTLLERYSQNHAKIFHFPEAVPFFEFDGDHNLILHVGEDFIKFQAEDFRKTESLGFHVSSKPKYYRNGTRAIPDVSYNGRQFHMVATNWSYPPLTGYFTLYDGSKRIGKVPTALLYKKMKNDRALPLFQKSGLLEYLASQRKAGRLTKRYGTDIRKFVDGLLRERNM
jgi:hypothetical protein